MVLGMTWLQKESLDSELKTRTRHWPTRTNAENRPMSLVSAGAFIATMHAVLMQGNKMHLSNINSKPFRDFIMASGLEQANAGSNWAYVQLYSEVV